MSPTLVRKFTETACHKFTPDAAPDVAKHLNHSERTARRHYVLVDKRQKAGAISSHIRNLQRGDFGALNEKKTEKEIMKEIVHKEIDSGGMSLIILSILELYIRFEGPITSLMSVHAREKRKKNRTCNCNKKVLKIDRIICHVPHSHPHRWNTHCQKTWIFPTSPSCRKKKHRLFFSLFESRNNINADFVSCHWYGVRILILLSDMFSRDFLSSSVTGYQ